MENVPRIVKVVNSILAEHEISSEAVQVTIVGKWSIRITPLQGLSQNVRNRILSELTGERGWIVNIQPNGGN